MFFTVLPVGGRPPASARARAFLVSDNWDDWFEFSTLFGLLFVNAEGEPQNIGGVKIAQFSMTKGQRRADVPQTFDALDQTFFSIGQDDSYYEKLNGLGSAIRDKILAGLQDLAFNPTLFNPCLSGYLTNVLACAILSNMDTTFPTSLPQFRRVFPDDGACARYLEAIRWPDGFSCQACGHTGEPYRFATRSSVVLRCRACKKNTSLTTGTVMQSSHMPLSTWFWGAYLMTTQTPGQSALQFQRQLDITTYETAFTMLHKLRAGMVRPDRDTIGAPHPVEVDECCIGGRTRGEGRGIHHQTTVVGAVEVRTRKDAENRSAKWKDAHEGGIPAKKLTYAGRLRLRVVSSIEQTDISLSGRDAESLTTFVKGNITTGSIVRTDGWQGYYGLGEMGYSHNALTLGGDPEKAEKHLPMIHLVFSNLKTGSMAPTMVG